MPCARGCKSHRGNKDSDASVQEGICRRGWKGDYKRLEELCGRENSNVRMCAENIQLGFRNNGNLRPCCFCEEKENRG